MKLGEVSMRSAGRTVGHLAAVNTLAAILGSLVAGFVLLEWIGLWAGLRLLAGVYLALALFLALRRSSLRALGLAPGLGRILLATLVNYAHYGSVHLDPSRGERVLRAWEGSHGTVVVIEQEGDRRIKVNNSYLLGTSKSALNLRLQSYLPLALHPRPRTVFYLGMGTGITAGGALDFPVQQVTVCELNGDVVQASREYFHPYVNGLFNDTRARIIQEDGRNYLFGTRERFDVIIADIFLTYRAGTGSLYTREHFEAVRNRLEPGGLFAQWLTMFDLSEQEMGIIVRTMLEVFPRVTLWRRSFSPRFPVFALVGQVDEVPLDAELLQTRMEELAGAGRLPADVWIRHIPLAAYAGNLTLAARLFAGYPLSTDDRTPLEYLAPAWSYPRPRPCSARAGCRRRDGPWRSTDGWWGTVGNSAKWRKYDC